MAYTSTPGNLFVGMSSDGTNLTIPIAALAAYGLTAPLAHQTTGDARVMAYAFGARIEAWYRGLTAANRPTALVAETKLSVVGLAAESFPGQGKEEIKITAYRNRPSGAMDVEP